MDLKRFFHIIHNVFIEFAQDRPLTEMSLRGLDKFKGKVCQKLLAIISKSSLRV